MREEQNFCVIVRSEFLGGEYGYEVFYVDVFNKAGIQLEGPGLQVWHPCTTDVNAVAEKWASFLGVDVEFA